MNYDVLENDSILIVPSQIKEKILTEMDKKSKLFNVKLMEINEFKRKYFFDYTTETIFYVMKHYNYDYEFSLDIINNLYFLSSEISAISILGFSKSNTTGPSFWVYLIT